MRIALLAFLTGLLAGCTTPPEQGATPPESQVVAPKLVASDPIDRLVADLSATHGMWRNGIFPALNLPLTATPEEVIKKRFDQDVAGGLFTSYKILRIRSVPIATTGYIGALADPPADSVWCTAALVETDSGKKILLMKYTGEQWWTRVYDTKPSAMR
jgi:hypothetical protein